MHRQPKKVTPLRQVRLATGLSQKQFADLVGVKYDLFQSIELGRAGLTDDNAYKIYQATGALPNSLDPSRSSCAMSGAEPGEPYSAQTWAVWQRDKPVLEASVSTQVKDLVGWTHFLCDVAGRNGKAWEVHSELAQALADCATEFGLEKTITHELRWVRLRSKVRYTYGELRRNPALAAAVGFKAETRRKGRIIRDKDWWTTTFVDRACWDPSGPFPQALAAKLSSLRPPTRTPKAAK